MSQNNLAIILSGGLGKRFDSKLPKQFYKIGKKYILNISVDKFLETNLFKKIIVVTSKKYLKLTKKIINKRDIQIILGDATRQGSVFNGIKMGQKYKLDNVLIHDSARPLLSTKLIKQLVMEIRNKKCVIPVINVNDSIRKINNSTYEEIDRENVKIVQTPQAFKFQEIRDAHNKQRNNKFTDDSIIVANNGIKVNSIEGEITNLKITTKNDLKFAEMVENHSNINSITKVGSGFDVHEFESGDHLILFGVKVPFDKKLKGHSDADVGFHAITDAILGSLGQGDIGEHFPPSEKKWKNKDSAFFLRFAKKKIQEKNLTINNLDITLICEKPKISNFKKKFEENISDILEIELNKINVKATTTEKLGFVGREEGIACHAIVTISGNV